MNWREFNSCRGRAHPRHRLPEVRESPRIIRKGPGARSLLSFAFQVDAVWDSVTLLVCLAGVFFLSRVRSVLRGGAVGGSYDYYLAAGAVLALGLAIRLVFDFQQVDPSVYGVSVRDAAIIISLALFVIGLRKAVKVWTPAGAPGS